MNTTTIAGNRVRAAAGTLFALAAALAVCVVTLFLDAAGGTGVVARREPDRDDHC